MQGLSLDLGLQCVSAVVEFAGAMCFDFTNVLNHMQPNDPALNIFSPGSYGVHGAVETAWNTPRQLQFGRQTSQCALEPDFSTAVPSSNGANYDPHGSGIGASTWPEPWDRQP